MTTAAKRRRLRLGTPEQVYWETERLRDVWVGGDLGFRCRPPPAAPPPLPVVNSFEEWQASLDCETRRLIGLDPKRGDAAPPIGFTTEPAP